MIKISLKLIPILLVLFLFLGCSQKEYTPTKPHHTKTGFKNLYIDDNEKKGGFFKFMRMKFFGEDKWADHEALKDQVTVIDVDTKLINSTTNTPRITWLGHASFLIQHQGLNILTDPIFSDRASPVSFAGPKRYTRHPMDYNNLPKIDIVLISHNHYDHLDEETVKKLVVRNSSTKYYVPLRLKETLTDFGVSDKNIFEFDWDDKSSITLNDTKLSIQALPLQHWSARGLKDRFQTLWVSWFVEFSDFNFWFAGDTGYNDIQFKQIGNSDKNIDLAFIPIGAYEPRWFMKKYHANPEEAVLIHKDIKAKKSIGIHWGTFPMTAEEPNAPVKDLNKAILKYKLQDNEFITLDIGETINYK